MTAEDNTTKIYVDSLFKAIDGLSSRFGKLENKIDEVQRRQSEERLSMYQAIQAVKEMAVEQNHRLSLKVHLLTGAIGIASGGAGSFLMQWIKGH